MKKLIRLFFLPLMMVIIAACSGKYNYETVPGDPLNARIYTLDNGLKIYLSVNKEAPRIQANIAVRVGGKNDPDETTGLAHYFEHLMFKGTEKFGTQNYAEEKPYLDKIEALFEVYRTKTDPEERTAIYKQIDSISYEASKLSIPNEYDKLMSAIGARGTNAYTSMDMTVYVEDIPSNEIENWAKIQSDRFENNVIRGFHTELETVYEEKNMSLTRDGRKVSEKILSELFKNHPYGTHTVLGTQEHLKNPSITNIKNYYKKWYVPNNMAICMAGDFNPDEVIVILNKYFGQMKPNKDLKEPAFTPESPITEPITTEVLGLEAENVTIAWRVPGEKSKESTVINMLSNVLTNGKAGIIDLNLNQQQKLLYAYAYYYNLPDAGMLCMGAAPKKGQTLEEVKDLLLQQMELLRKGEFANDLLVSVVNNVKRDLQSTLESNDARADMFVQAFINETPWKDEVAELDNISKVTKENIVTFAQKYLKDDNYVVVYKREGKDPNELKMEKPHITPIQMNRDNASAFLLEIQNSTAKPIEPVFLDYSKDLAKFDIKSSIPVLYKQNVTNDLFSLTYVFDMGTNDDKTLGTAVQYLEYLGTSTMTPEQLKQEFYKLACDYSVSVGSERIYVTLSGLNESMPSALKLFEDVLADAQPNVEVLNNMKSDILKDRIDNKKSQRTNFSRLQMYAMYGANSPSLNIMSEKELNSLKPEDLLSKTKQLNGYEHTILYYGTLAKEDVVKELNTLHRVPETLKPLEITKRDMLLTKENKVLVAPYAAKQVYMGGFSNRGELFDLSVTPIATLYNDYFGGGMNAIVFQEMREARGLAYSASAGLRQPSRLDRPYYYNMFIATQNDKVIDAMKAFDEIINDMPESEKAFALSKESLITNIRTSRVTKASVLWDYMSAQDLGLNVDRRKLLFEELQTLTLSDVKKFQEKWVKNRTYTYYILGDEKDIDLDALKSYGKITKLKTETIFGY
ncbi:MAG: insulinase family protein [Culturomica sp.]|jgi:predicted Zn-dependent peptidase|nr:insulinase family protein [Culturomica sp.]